MVYVNVRIDQALEYVHPSPQQKPKVKIAVSRQLRSETRAVWAARSVARGGQGREGVETPPPSSGAIRRRSSTLPAPPASTPTPSLSLSPAAGRPTTLIAAIDRPPIIPSLLLSLSLPRQSVSALARSPSRRRPASSQTGTHPTFPRFFYTYTSFLWALRCPGLRTRSRLDSEEDA